MKSVRKLLMFYKKIKKKIEEFDERICSQFIITKKNIFDFERERDLTSFINTR